MLRYTSEISVRNPRAFAGCVSEEQDGDVTILLQRWRVGSPAARESLIPLVYSQLHAIANGYMRRERGGVGSMKVPLSDELAWVGNSPDQMLDLNRALDKLEAADTLGISLPTAARDLKFARSWLHRELNSM